MKKFLSLLTIFAITCSIHAQDSTSKGIVRPVRGGGSNISNAQPKQGWTKGATASLSLNQVGNSNWNTAGSDKFTLTTFATVNLFANKLDGNKFWTNNLDIVYGLTNTTANGIRKVNDRIDFISKLGMQTKKWKNVSRVLLGQMRSQLTDGYQYDYFGTTTKRKTSGFFAPAYIVVAPGIEVKPCSCFSIYGSLTAFRATIVSNGPYSYAAQGGVFHGNVETPLASLYGVNPTKQHRVEFGSFVTMSLQKNLAKNLSYKSKLDLYSNYIRRKQAIVGFGFNKNVDLFWSNQFNLKVNKWLQVSYNFDLQYDDDMKNPVKPTSAIGLQALSTLGVGAVIKL